LFVSLKLSAIKYKEKSSFALLKCLNIVNQIRGIKQERGIQSGKDAKFFL